MVDGTEYCHRCGQSRSTHDDGECAAVTRSMSQAAKAVHVPGPGAEEIARRLTAMAEVARGTVTLGGWAWIDEQLDSLKEMVALESWKLDHGRNK